MDRNNLVYDPAAQMYRQNPLDPAGAAFGQMDGVSGAATDQPAAADRQQNYPAWLTDLSARGLASDWLPAAFVPTPADELHPRIIPPDAPVAAPTAPLSAGTNAASTSFGGGQEGGGGGGNDPSSGGNSPEQAGAASNGSSADASSPDNAGSAGGSSDAGGGVGSSGDSGSSGGGAGDASGGSADAGSDGGFSRGGIVSPNKLVGPNPPGPDTGFGALKPGEGVLTDKAMKFYGKGIIAKLNKLAVPKEMFR